MTRLLLSALLASLLAQSASAAHTGYAARYRSEQLMRRAAAVHGVEVPDGLEVCAATYHPLGTIITVRSSTRRTAWRCIVGDVPHARDRASIVRRNIIVEVTPRGAMRLCGSVEDPPRQCPVEVSL